MAIGRKQSHPEDPNKPPPAAGMAIRKLVRSMGRGVGWKICERCGWDDHLAFQNPFDMKRQFKLDRRTKLMCVYCAHVSDRDFGN